MSAALPPVRASLTAGSPGAAHRVIFVDLARALAVVFMLYGHAISALLDPRYQTGGWFEVWQFQRGLTSSLFLLVSGFAFSIATARHWALHLRWSRALFRRLRRFVLLIVLGYGLHFPVARFVLLPAAPDDRWRAFLAVDVLQLIGASFLGIQLLVWLTRSRGLFAVAAFALSGVIVSMTPAVWSVEWSGRLPLLLTGYLSPEIGSLFPLFPWAAYILLGAGLGQTYSRWGAADLKRYAVWALLVPGLLLLGASDLLIRVLGPDVPADFVPANVLLRWGASLLILSALALASLWIAHLPHVFAAVAQESLLIYFVHLCLVYGSVWNRGLVHRFGMALGPGETALVVAGLLLAMVLLAVTWNRWKHVRPRSARWAARLAGGLLVARLL